MPDLTVLALFDEQIAAERKTCTLCKVSKPLDEFGFDHRATARRLPRCKPCTTISTAAYGAKYRAKTPPPQLGPLPVEKRCNQCRHTKPLDAFASQKRGLYGRYCRCKDCNNGNRARLRREQPELVRAKDTARRAANPAAYRAYNTAWANAKYQANPEAARAKQNAQRRANPEATRALWNAWRAANPERWRAIARLAQHRRRAKLQNTLVLPFTQDQLLAKMAYWGNRCYLCRGAWTAIDHVKPVHQGGGHLLANFRPVCTSCNSRKGRKWEGPRWAMALLDLYHASS